MSKIEWTEQTWNPIVGCTIVSPGCTNCYAMNMAARIERMSPALEHYRGLTKPTKAGAVWTGKMALATEATLLAPLKRKKPTTYFVNSMSDLFHESVPDEWIDRVFAVMALSPQHTFQVLTKRAARMRAYMSESDVADGWVETPEWDDRFDQHHRPARPHHQRMGQVPAAVETPDPRAGRNQPRADAREVIIPLRRAPGQTGAGLDA